MDKRMKIAIHETLNQIGVPHNLKGRSYLVSSIEKCVEDKSKICRIVKGLYEELAEENKDKPERVERAIRHAIEVAWERGNEAVINKVFGYTVSYEKGRPTNSEFIANLADFVSLYFEEIADGTYSFER